MQLHCRGTQGPGFNIEDDLFENLNMDEDGLDIENYDELFGVCRSYSEELLENGGIDSLFRIKGISAAKSGCPEVLQSPCNNSLFYCLLEKLASHCFDIICHLLS